VSQAGGEASAPPPASFSTIGQENFVVDGPHDPARRAAPCIATTGEITIYQTGEHAALPATPTADRMYRLWVAGDDDLIAAGFRHGAEAFVGRGCLGPGIQVLDAACGSGNATIPAARTGATVTGIDLVAAALETASDRAAREGLRVTLDQGSVEVMPYPDGAFEVVLSLFGVMFAARPDRVLSELARVTRPGGRVFLASWTPGGFMGELHAIQASHVPPYPDLPDPLRWGDPDVVRDWFDDGRWEATTALRTLSLGYAHTPEGTTELFRAAYAPTVRAFESLDEDRRAALAADLTARWTRHRRATAAGTEVEAEFLEVVAVRR
jgi:SAM-dependent methyltransferase